MLSDEATPDTKGKVFGFHRSMDTLGAVFGPSLALIYLYCRPGDYKNLFFIAFLPGLFAVLASFLLKKEVKNSKPDKPIESVAFFSFIHYWKGSSIEYKKLVAGLLVFALFNSSDVFLLLKAKEAGLNDGSVIGVYIFYNLVYALFGFPMGMLADRIGLKRVFVVGLVLFSMVYFGMAISTGIYFFFALFFLYGVYAAASEGICKAWISNVAQKEDTATAIGFFTGFQSICTLLASSLTGIIWFRFGATIAFVVTASASLFVALFFMTKIPENN